MQNFGLGATQNFGLEVMQNFGLGATQNFGLGATQNFGLGATQNFASLSFHYAFRKAGTQTIDQLGLPSAEERISTNFEEVFRELDCQKRKYLLKI